MHILYLHVYTEQGEKEPDVGAVMHVHEMTVVTVHFAEIKQNLVAQVKRKRHAFIASAFKIQVSGICSMLSMYFMSYM